MMHVHAWRPAVPTALIAALAVVPALALSATPAFAHNANAANDPAVHHMVVSYHDLDLATPKGRTVLERRLRESAAAVCSYDMLARQSFGSTNERACYSVAMANARTSMAAAINKTQMASSR